MATQLPLSTRINYGVSEMGVNVFVVLASVAIFEYMLLSLKIPALWAGTIFLATKIWDVVTDPLIGRWSDGFQSRFGRRLPFMTVGAFVLALGFALIFLAPFGDEGAWQMRALWVTFALIFTYTGLTLIGVPYGAMTVELTQDYQERSNLTAIRMTFATIGLLAGFVLFFALIEGFANLNSASFPADYLYGYRMAGILMFPLLCLPTLWTVFGLRNVKLRNARPQPLSLLNQARLVWSNGPFRWLALTYVVQVSMITQVVSSLTLIALYIMGAQSESAARDLQTELYLIISLMALLSFPGWLLLGRQFEKRTLHMAFTFGFGVAMSAMILLSPGSYFLLFALMAVLGIFYGGYSLFPWAMLPDVISHAQAMRGGSESLEGLFNGWWTAFQKLGIAFGPFLIGLALSTAGFVEGEPGQPLPTAEQQGASAIRALHAMISIIPGLGFLATLLMMRNYRLTKADQDQAAETEASSIFD